MMSVMPVTSYLSVLFHFTLLPLSLFLLSHCSLLITCNCCYFYCSSSFYPSTEQLSRVYSNESVCVCASFRSFDGMTKRRAKQRIKRRIIFFFFRHCLLVRRNCAANSCKSTLCLLEFALSENSSRARSMAFCGVLSRSLALVGVLFRILAQSRVE